MLPLYPKSYYTSMYIHTYIEMEKIVYAKITDFTNPLSSINFYHAIRQQVYRCWSWSFACHIIA